MAYSFYNFGVMSAQPFSMFIVEDDVWFNKLLVHTISLNPDYVVKSFSSSKDFIAHLNENPDVVTLDYRLPDGQGEEVLQKIKGYNPNIEVVVISEQENIETAVELLRLGAYDYIVKGKDIRDRLLN